MWDAIWNDENADRWDEVEREVIDLDPADEDEDGEVTLDLDADEVVSLDEWLDALN